VLMGTQTIPRTDKAPAPRCAGVFSRAMVAMGKVRRPIGLDGSLGTKSLNPRRWREIKVPRTNGRHSAWVSVLLHLELRMPRTGTPPRMVAGCVDVSTDLAHELPPRCDLLMRDVPFLLQDFVANM
jgi:hypothetical protein